MQHNKKIAVLSYNSNKYCETFISNQVKHLEGEVHLLHGGALPIYASLYSPILPANKLVKITDDVPEVLLHHNLKQQHEAVIEKYLIENGIEVVLANFALTAFALMDICERNNIPLVVHFHGWTAYRRSVLEEYKELYPVLFEKAAAIVAVSKDMVRQLEQLGAPACKIHYTSCGADTDMFTYSERDFKIPRFFAAGRFCDTKAPHLTLLAFAQTHKQLPRAQLVMAGGDENLLYACMGLVKALGIENAVAFKGVLTHREIRDEMERASYFVQHSVTTPEGDKEGTPVAVMEAMATGLPVIATRHGGIADLIQHGHNGWLCEEFDIIAMADLMLNAAVNAGEAKRVGYQAAQTVASHFSLKQYIVSLNNILDMVRK